MAMSASTRAARRRALRRIGLAASAFAALIGVILFFVFGNNGSTPPQDPKSEEPTASAQAPTTEPQPADLVSCVKVEFDRNANFNVVSKVTDVGYAINNRNEDLAAMKKDPRNLAFRAWQMTLWPEHSQWQSLVSGNCLSKQGVDLYNRVFNVLMGRDSNIKLVSMDENSQAPAHYTNSGMDNGTPVINASSGIDGDRAAIKYSIRLAGGSAPMDIYVLKRCGNPTFASRPPLPVRHISPPPPRGTGTPPRPTPPRSTPPPPPPPPPPPCDECCEGPCPPPPCPPGTIGENGICKDLPTRDPYPNGNAPQGGGPNRDQTEGEYIPPEQMEQPPAVQPPPPPPPPATPPPSATPTSVAPQPVDPGATLTPDMPGVNEDGDLEGEVDDS